METSRQILANEKRAQRSKDCKIQFTSMDYNSANFFVLDIDDSIKYVGRVERYPSIEEACTCPDQFHRNNTEYKNEHGFSLNCKHMIKAKSMLRWK